MELNKWGQRVLTIKVYNKVCGRVDVHKNINQQELSWFTCNPNLEIEILKKSE